MPTYFARGVAVRLGTQPLVDTITPKIAVRKGDDAKRQCEDAEQKLRGSRMLSEKHVQFPHDEAGFDLNWLGNAPFMQVRAGDNLFAGRCEYPTPPSETSHSTYFLPAHADGESRTKDDHTSLALSLHVKLSERTFLSGLGTSDRLHLKIDVLFNGKLSSCVFIPFHDIRSGSKQYHQVFAGHRVDFLAERPWVVLSPQKFAADGQHTTTQTLPAERRWKEIGNALVQEANERGMDSKGVLPPTAEYLLALASMQMPEEITSLQKSSSRTFGVIDVIITAGGGRKVS